LTISFTGKGKITDKIKGVGRHVEGASSLPYSCHCCGNGSDSLDILHCKLLIAMSSAL